MLSKVMEEYINEYCVFWRKETLDLTYFKDDEERDITNEEIMEVASFLMENPAITALTIIIPELSPEAVQALVKTPLKKLSLESSGISTEGVSALAGSNLEELWLEQCGITDKEAEILFSSQSLNKLVLAHNQITGKSLEKLVTNTSLKDIDLSHNEIENEYCRFIGLNQSLKILNLSDNEDIGDEGFKALATSSSLEEIYLTDAKITTICPLNPALKKLVLFDNDISNIEELLKREPLQEVRLGDNSISEEDYERLKKHYPKSAGWNFYGEISPPLEPTKDELIQGEEPKKKKLKI